MHRSLWNCADDFSHAHLSRPSALQLLNNRYLGVAALTSWRKYRIRPSYCEAPVYLHFALNPAYCLSSYESDGREKGKIEGEGSCFSTTFTRTKAIALLAQNEVHSFTVSPSPVCQMPLGVCDQDRMVLVMPCLSLAFDTLPCT